MAIIKPSPMITAFHLIVAPFRHLYTSRELSQTVLRMHHHTMHVREALAHAYT